MSYKSIRMQWIDAILETPKGMIIFGIVAILLGIVFAVVAPMGMDPVDREEAVAYEGEFEKFREGKNFKTIYFADGTEYDVYAHTTPEEFCERIRALEKGTKLYLLINPSSGYAAEVRTDTEELLNFETSQQEAADYQIGYVIIGVLVVVAGGFIIVYAILSVQNKKTAEMRKKRPSSKAPLRPAENGRARILLEAQKGHYTICYRRAGITNELVINGEVWDEIKAVIEEKHRLSAIVDGNKIEAGYSESPSVSYIKFNGCRIAHKKRWI